MSIEAGRLGLGSFIRQSQSEILDEWERRVRALSPARKLTAEELRDHLPHVIERIVELSETLDEHCEVSKELSERHALDRLYEGYDLADIVREYALLREVILDASERAGAAGVRDLRILSRVLDQATEGAVSHYARASQRILKALDRISSEAVGSQGLDALLSRILTAMLEATPAVDEATILLREDDRLVVRASVGLLRDRPVGFSLAIGEGFSGTIANDGQPRLVRNAANDPIIKNQDLRASGIRALYGVPLLDGTVIGVAHIGSRTAFEFSDEDKLLFRAMANRATAFIVEERLRERERRTRAELEAVLQSIPAGVYVGDKNGIRLANRVGLELMGVHNAEELKQPIDALMRRTSQRHAETGLPLKADELVFARALRGETAQAEVALTSMKDNREIIVHSVAAPIYLNEQISGAVAVNTDITARKRAEMELRRVAEYRERFIGILGHDLRSPVAAISLSATLLLMQGQLPQHLCRIVRRIASSAERIDRMIRDLVDFSRARGNGLSLQRAGMDLHEATVEVVDELAVTHPQRRIEVEAHGNLLGTWDRAHLGRVVSNLVSNALHYSPPDSPVSVELTGYQDRVELRVSNEGEPIPEELQSHLFEPFRRGRAATVSQPGGLGLGLFIVRSIIEAHGGSIRVESTRQRTNFTVSLPRAA
jgi:signal transduction histidine kinase/putative methionine-R-sulfoxide reductase with GAF domain